jgi:hypothetical protein
MDLAKLVERGVAAQALLQDPMFQEAWDTMAKAIIERWEACPIRDLEGQQQLKLMRKLLDDLRAVFELAVTDGNEARRELDRLNKQVLSPRQWMGR